MFKDVGESFTEEGHIRDNRDAQTMNIAGDYGRRVRLQLRIHSGSLFHPARPPTPIRPGAEGGRAVLCPLQISPVGSTSSRGSSSDYGRVVMGSPACLTHGSERLTRGPGRVDAKMNPRPAPAF